MGTRRISDRRGLSSPGRHYRTWAVGLLLALAVAACGRTTVTTEEAYTGSEQLPKPDRVLVYNFAVSPEEVELGRGLGSRIENLLSGSPRSDEERAAGHEVADALAEHLVEDIRNLGLPVERAVDTNTLPAGGTTLAIRGQLLSIDEGNRTERIVIGLGAGRTEVEADVQVYEASARGPHLLEKFEAAADSGRKPGMAETMGVGAAAGDLATSAAAGAGLAAGSETFGSDVEADADRMAAQITETLAPFFAKQGWIAATSAQ